MTYLLDINVIIQLLELEKGVREARRWGWGAGGARLGSRSGVRWEYWLQGWDREGKVGYGGGGIGEPGWGGGGEKRGDLRKRRRRQSCATRRAWDWWSEGPDRGQGMEGWAGAAG